MHTVEIYIIEIGMVEIKIAEDTLRGCMNNHLYDNLFVYSKSEYTIESVSVSGRPSVYTITLHNYIRLC